MNFNQIISNPSTLFYLQLLIAGICFIEFIIFWRKRNYYRSIGYMEAGFGRGSSSKSPQYSWAITMACWGLVELLELWDLKQIFSLL